ncbi:MAG: helix-turn-helix domain-containing protein [Lachnospiraceae bacterium]|nr:helix-turn-helix domain-containing protein [Lachnospiraceae bacterium]
MLVRPEYNFKTIGDNLKRLRQAKGLSVEQVREYLQLGSVQAIYKWERGVGLPQADTLIALMMLYGENRIDVITEENAEFSSVCVYGRCA